MGGLETYFAARCRMSKPNMFSDVQLHMQSHKNANGTMQSNLLFSMNCVSVEK